MPNGVATYLKDTKEFDLVYINNSVFSDAHIFLAYYLSIDPTWYQENVVRPEPDSFGFSHPTSLGEYVFGAESFEKVFCGNLEKNGVYISDQSLKGDFFFTPGMEKRTYSDQDFKNFSGVHTQARVITFAGMNAFMQSYGISAETYCKNRNL
jgi:hypothetical protein